ncbi:MAG TPA: DNA translocase FtsK [Xanthobacteraceae bacterium]|nr:DNA translocase FtsK [Xanthobacteraceae bacterium]
MRTISTRASFFLPDALLGVLRRRVAELSGLAIIAAAGIVLLALATWSALDPNLNHATGGAARNFVGRPGAAVADFLMQLFGLASVVLVLPAGVWGWRLLTHRGPVRMRVRLVAWVVGLVFATGFVACFKVTANWPLPTGLGGVLGDALLKVPALFAGAGMGGLARLVTGTVFATLAAAALLVACGFGFTEPPARPARRDIEDEDEVDDRPGRIALIQGALSHGLLALKARFSRLLPARRALARAVSSQVSGHDGRRETSLDAADAVEDEFEAPRHSKRAIASQRRRRTARSRGDRYEMPPLELLTAGPKERAPTLSAAALAENAQDLENVLEDFGVRGEIVNVRPGPVVTLYELEPAAGIKSSRVIGLADDIARSMSAISARVAVVSGRNAIGIELPNPKREKVVLRELLATDDIANSTARLPLCLGKTIGGDPVIVDLARMPHLLIAGTTGSGKSVAINTMILSLLYRLKPEECRLILIDPKMLELSVYDGIPHLLAPVVTDPRKAIVALKWTVREMEERYKKMSKVGVRNIEGFNARLAAAREKDEAIVRTVQTGFDRETGEAIYEREEMDLAPLPQIVVVVDEMADLMMLAGKDIEGAIQRLSQMARAAGIHLLMATQRPSVDVITGTIKANFPTRISFQVPSKIDSRTILNEPGAEQLLGQGDMLYMAGGGRISRVHGPFVSDIEVERVVAHLKEQGVPEYLEAVTAEPDEDIDGTVFDKGAFGEDGGGDLYAQAVRVVLRDRKASTSYVQRRLQIGYNRAASIIERMEKEGIVGAANHAGKREILVDEPAEQAY